MFTQFVVLLEVVSAHDASRDEFWRMLPYQLPVWIVAFIMNKADDTDVFTGKPKPPDTPRTTYANAQKLRAAISHKFGRGFKLGTLRRRKVRQGKQVTSARAINHHTMKTLWEFNSAFPRSDPKPQTQQKRKAKPDRNWGGYHTRQMLHALYVVSMLCLLRYDEALRIIWSDISLEFRDNAPVAVLTLPFRKTHQNGECAPFTLWQNEERPWMDGVKALATWWHICQETGLIRTDMSSVPAGMGVMK
ncbi:hypothetical protein LXA43DRAFT_1103955 [Ganoderma leucocontextum]|nr:hypothetical protein LXA43DRAFT_1103955 [Ganoderma leucocontextum]